MQRDRKKILEESEEVARRLAEEKFKRDHGEVIEQLKDSIAVVRLKASNDVSSLTALLEVPAKEVEESKREQCDAKEVVGGLCGDLERVTHERDGQRA